MLGAVDMRRRMVGMLLVVAVFVVAAAVWAPIASADGVWKNLGTFSGSVSCVQAVDFNTVLVGGSVTPPNVSGTVMPSAYIFRSTNGGTSFAYIKESEYFSVSALDFYDASHGWLIGSAWDPVGPCKTSDGGLSWMSMPNLALKGGAEAISFTDALNGWAVGDGCSIQHTGTGGTTWTVQVAKTQPGPDLLSVDFADANNGWAAGGIKGGGAGLIRHTSNGGVAWDTQKSGLSNCLTGIAFADTMHGVACGKKGTLLVTANGGTTWTQVKVPGDAGQYGLDINAVAWADATHVFAVGDSGTFLASANRGASWSDESDSGIKGDFFAMGAAGGTRVWVTAGQSLYRFTYSPPPTKWTKRVSGTTAFLYAVDFVDKSYGWAVGSQGTILKSTNGGKTWATLSKGKAYTLSGVDFVSRTTGWVIGNVPYNPAQPLQPTVILKTTNGGKTWAPQAHPNDKTYVFRIRMRTATDGWILGENWRVDQAPPPKPYSSILRTTDGGAHWIQHPDSPPDLVRDVTFPSGSVGYAVGYRGNNFKTVNGGTNWTPMPGLTGILRVMGVAFTSPTNGIAAGDKAVDTVSPGLISHTTDGGQTWKLTPVPCTSQLRCATSYGSSIWVVGEGGKMLRSGDGGLSWGLQPVGTGAPLWGVQSLGNDFVVAVGGGGTILTGTRPQAVLSKPKLGWPVHYKKFLQITGTVKPYVRGSKTKVVVYRRVSGKWKKWKTVNADNQDYGGYATYWANVTSSTPKGTFSAIATFGNADYAPKSSARFTFKVK
jgi:photosystem II stability/assembly factor-like uncharacterized protein